MRSGGDNQLALVQLTGVVCDAGGGGVRACLCEICLKELIVQV